MPINNFLLPGAKVTPAYEVANSCRFDEASTAYQHITYGSAGNQKTWTFSVWFKRASTGAQHDFWSVGSANNTFGIVYISSNDDFTFYEADSGSTTAFLQSNRLFRDLGAWYHVLFSLDTTQSTANNRQRLWVNGTEVTDFQYRTNPSLNADLKINSAAKHYLGGSSTGLSGLEYNGYMAEVVFLDGTAVTGATDFGEFDEDSPTIWKPKDVSGLSFGSNGFYLDFEDSSNLGNNAGSGAADLTEVNLAAADQATDTPTNSFCTFNPLENYYADSTFSEGNCKIVSASSPFTYNVANIGVSSGKWYAEIKPTAVGNGTGDLLIGISSTQTTANNKPLGYYPNDVAYRGSGNKKINDSDSSYGDTYSTNDIIGIALDLDNNKLYFAKNGTWQNSGDPTSGATGTGAISVTAPASTPLGFYFFGVCYVHDSASGTFESNFGGCPVFSISSGNADANGYGNFEYAPPSGFYALCTQNLAEFGG